MVGPQALADLADRAVGVARQVRVGGEVVLHPLLLQHPAHRPGQGAALLQELLPVFRLAVRVQEHRDPGLGGVVELFHHEAPASRALGPGDVLHGLPARVLPEARGQHRVLVDEPPHGHVPQKAAEHVGKALVLRLPGGHHHGPELSGPAHLLIQAQKVAAGELQGHEGIEPPAPDGHRHPEADLLPGPEPCGEADVGAALHVLPGPGGVLVDGEVPGQLFLQLGKEDIVPSGVLQRQLHAEHLVRVHQALVGAVVLPHLRKALGPGLPLERQHQQHHGNGK